MGEIEYFLALVNLRIDYEGAYYDILHMERYDSNFWTDNWKKVRKWTYESQLNEN